MIGVMFQFGNEYITAEVRGTELYFRTADYNTQAAPLDSVKLDRAGVIKEFPDLAFADDWRQKALERLKMKIKDMASEIERINYTITDLKQFGYIPYAYQKQGHRVKRFREGNFKIE
jgi:hypothetical protein